MCHVLVIEDEWAIADLICEYLSAAGATSFDVAGTEREAVELATLHTPDVITSDIRLIEGTGPSAVTLIHDKLGQIPTIFITATPADFYLGDKAVAVLQKPFAGPALTDAFTVARSCPDRRKASQLMTPDGFV